MAGYGGRRDIFYDPSNPSFNTTNCWDYAADFRILDYVFLFPGAGMNQSTTRPEQPYWRTNALGSMDQPASATEIILDIVVRDTGTLSYSRISVGGLPKDILQRTSHLEGQQPGGGNELFIDGHVEWRPFRIMLQKPQKYFGDNPMFIF